MSKVLLTSVAVALLLGTAALGGIGDINLIGQQWQLGLNSTTEVDSGIGEAHNMSFLGATSAQSTSTAEGTSAGQGFCGISIQAADVKTAGAKASVEQDFTADAIEAEVGGTDVLGQTQIIGAHAGPALQFQGASIGAEQTVEKEQGGPSEAGGLNGFVWCMSQEGENTCADMDQSSVVVGAQFSDVAGTCAATADVNTTATAVIGQAQVVNN